MFINTMRGIHVYKFTREYYQSHTECNGSMEELIQAVKNAGRSITLMSLETNFRKLMANVAVETNTVMYHVE